MGIFKKKTPEQEQADKEAEYQQIKKDVLYYSKDGQFCIIDILPYPYSWTFRLLRELKEEGFTIVANAGEESCGLLLEKKK